MADFFEVKRRKAQKEYSCKLCSGKIEKKEFYLDEKGMFEGEFYNDKYHESCMDHINAYCDEYQRDTFSKEGLMDFLYDNNCYHCENQKNKKCVLNKNIYRCEKIIF